ncbi:MAG TPA: glycerol-3-phosphate transporter [Solidesulfovibrio magneticus]|nr:glycerol-3-phosphate transporter [Solidesulfovibrio magneticus]
MIGFFKPAEHIERLPQDKHGSHYKALRWQIFLSIFFGYAAYYLVRKNISLAVPDLLKLGFTKTDMGFVMSAGAISYGIAKFVMGMVSDRSNPRYFFSAGLLLSGGVMLFMGFSPWAVSSVAIMYALQFVNGWVQGMGWPPCGRTMVHWWSTHERGKIVSVWNVAHNLGGGLVANLAVWGVGYFNEWQAKLYVPAGVAVGIAVLLIITMRDTPQSCGLPPIEEHNNDYPPSYSEDQELEMTTKEIFVKYILPNKYLWYIAIANIFVYFIRYGVLDWAPTYLREVKGFDFKQAGLAYSLYEYAAIPGTILCGWISDQYFKSRRAPAGILFMVPTVLAVAFYWLNKSGSAAIDSWALLAIGFFVYGPVMLIGLHALDLVPKKAAGTAAGLTGLFGYVLGTVVANWVTGWVIQHYGWDWYFGLMLIAGLLAILAIALTWGHGATSEKRDGNGNGASPEAAKS